MNAQEIYNILRAGGLTRAGALGVLGNMMAESSLIPSIAQRGMTSMSDNEYTAAADTNTIDFANDSVGYGLCQWTHFTRKKALAQYAKQMNTSVGDGIMQSYFCLHELRENYSAVYNTLCASTNIDECTDLVCVRYECPAENNYRTRREFAHTFEKDIPDNANSIRSSNQEKFPRDPSVVCIQLVMNYNGYWGKPDGYKTPEFFSSLRTFIDDMEKC